MLGVPRTLYRLFRPVDGESSGPVSMTGSFGMWTNSSLSPSGSVKKTV